MQSLKRWSVGWGASHGAACTTLGVCAHERRTTVVMRTTHERRKWAAISN